MPRYRDDRHLQVIEVWIVPARRLRIIHCDEKAGIVLVGDLISSKVEGVHADAMQWLFIIAPDFAAHPKPTAWDAHHYWFPGFDPGSWRGCHTRPSNPNSHLQPGGNGLREHDTLEQRPRAKVIRSVFVHPTCPTSHNAFSGLTSVLPTIRPKCAVRIYSSAFMKAHWFFWSPRSIASTYPIGGEQAGRCF